MEVTFQCKLFMLIFLAEKDVAKCYVNAYEEMYEKLVVLLSGDENMHDAFGEEEEVDSVASFVVLPGWVDDAPPPPIDNIIPANINELDESGHDSTSLWCSLEEYYASDSEQEDSILPLPGIPSYGVRPPQPHHRLLILIILPLKWGVNPPPCLGFPCFQIPSPTPLSVIQYVHSHLCKNY
ncbi:UNVERIFIED_CONTAM: hypothetical protein Slati_2518800 [Sesamum latifolium]|uniref:Uncharacterized protein n=1 Tax=Sesamum latifolium TaxID=2727402 RepID=A0AAW2WG18_9LAMI